MIVVFFSKDRPLQLDAALRSWRRQCHDADLAQAIVLYKASDSRLLSLYRRLSADHPWADFVREYDFRRDLLTLLRGAPEIGFVVDDTIFIRPFGLAVIQSALAQQKKAVGFSLRLGRNTTYCYSLNRPQALPPFAPLIEGVLEFPWPNAEADFAYPLELSSSMYRSLEIFPLLETLDYKHPNSLETVLAGEARRFFAESHPLLLCAPHSLAFSVPANKVQQVYDNRAGENPAYSAASLAQAFAAGQRIDLARFEAFTPQACHEEVELSLIDSAPPVPLVSIILPCYKQAEFLPDSVGSVLAQTFKDWELIIVNDGSPDDTNAVARRLIAEHPHSRIRLLEKANGGLAHARNIAIQSAAGAYILPLDADDKLTPTYLEKTVALLNAHPEIAIAYTDVVHFGLVDKTVQAAEFDPIKIRGGNQLNYCSLFRREAWELAGGFNSNMIWGYEDWDFWVACAEKELVAKRIPEPLFLYRIRAQSMFAGAMAHDQHLRWRVALNHPALYDAATLRDAQKFWSGHDLPSAPHAPKVSVIVPTHNRPARLAETLRSVLAQTFRDLEILVVNDCAVDVEHVIARLQSPLPIFHFRHHANRGLAGARNTGLRFARGKYIAFLDDDDVFAPNHLETLVALLEKTGARAAYADATCAEETLRNGAYETVRRTTPYSEDWDADRILVRNFVPVQCFVHERAAAIAAGPLDETLTTHEDWEYWIRVSQVAPPVHLKEITTEFRTRVDGSSMTSRLRADFLRTIRIIHARHRHLAHNRSAVRSEQRKFLRSIEGEYYRRNPPAWRRWLRGIFRK